MKSTRWKVLMVAGDPADFDLVNRLLSETHQRRFTLRWVKTWGGALKALMARPYDVVLMDEALSAQSGRALCRAIAGQKMATPVVLLTAEEDGSEPGCASLGAVVDCLPRAGLTPLLLDRAFRYAVERTHAIANANREQELSRINRTLLALGQSSVALMHARDEATYLNEFCRIISEDCGYTLVWIGFVEHDSDRSVRQVAFAGFDAGYINQMQLSWGDNERGQGPTGVAIRSGQVAQCRDMATDPAFGPWREEALRRGYRSSIVFPLSMGSEIIGALSIYSPEVDGFSQNEIDLLGEMSNNLSYGIHILRLRKAQAQAAAELSRQREWLRVTLTSIGDGVIAVGADGRVALMNRVATALTGWTEEEAIGQPVQSVFALVEDEKRIPVDTYLALALAGKGVPTHTGHTTLIARDGREVPVGHSSAPIMDDQGNILGVVLVFQDITEKQAMERELESEQRKLAYLATFPAQNPNPMIEIDLSGVVQYANPAAGDIAEHWLAEWMGNWPEVVAFFSQGTARSFSRDVAIGELYYQQLLLYFEDRGVIRIYATNITQRRRIEQELAASQHEAIEERNRLLAVMEALPVGVAIMDSQGGQVRVNRHYEEIWGAPLPKTESVQDYGAYRAVWPDSGQAVKAEEWAAYRAVMGGETVTGQVMAIKRFDGASQTVLNGAAPIFNAEGSITGCVVAIMDITERTRMEEELRRAQERIAGIISDIGDRSQSIQVLEKRVSERTLELSTLLAVSDDLGSNQELDTLIDSILDQLSLAVPYTSSLVMLVSEGRLEVASMREEGKKLAPIQGPIPLRQFRAFEGLVKSRRLSLMEDLGEHPLEATAILADYALVYPGEPPEVSSWLGVPLVVKKQAIGILSLGSSQPGAFSHSTTPLVQGIANQAAVAIDNMRLYTQARDLAALNERQRLARELHDSVSQALYGISLGTHVAIASINRDEQKLKEALDYILSLSDSGLTEMRALIFDLRPESLAQEGVVSALQKQALALEARRGIQVTVTMGDEPEAPYEIKEVLYRVCLEAMNNAARHARPTAIGVRLEATPGGLELAIHDDGIGFDPAQVYPGHLGLASMRERAAQVGGSLSIESAPGRGSTITLRVPLAAGG